MWAFERANPMIQGIYLARQGMTALMEKQDQIANNLANANTTGFKQSGLFLKAYQKYLANDLQQPFANREIKSDQVYVDYTEGTQKQTGNPLDVSIHGSGFFTVMTPHGTAYTRNGNFALDAEGYMVTSDGYKVMSNDGYVRVDSDKGPVTISEKGEVYQDGDLRSVMRIADFNKPYKLSRQGSGCFVPLEPNNQVIQSPGFQIKQGYLEGSNVSVIRSMVDMISTYRIYEADQKAMIAQDETLGRAVNDVGRV
jgi:flagellar basal-body rod protein FlgG